MKNPGILTRILIKAVKAIDGMRHPTGGGLWSWLMSRTKIDYEKEVGEGNTSSVLMAVVFWIMTRFAEAKYKMTIDDEVIDDHDILKLLRKPNPFYSGRLLRMACALSYCLDGNIYILKIRNKQFKVVQLWYVPHFLIKPCWPDHSTSIYIDHYKYTPGIETYEISPEDVIHIKFGIDPYNTRQGICRLKSLYREIFTDDEAANFSASMLRNMGIPGLIISPGNDNAIVDNDDKKAIEERLNNGYVRDGRGKAFVMTAKTDIKQFGFSPSAMDLGGMREIPEERVTAIFGVPAAVVGFGTGLQQTKVGATMKEMRESAYEDCIIPMQNLYAEEMNNQLMPDFESQPEKYKIDFDLSDIRVLQEDENAKSTRVIAEVNNTMITLAEGRKILGHEVKPEHEVWIVGTGKTIVPAGDLAIPIEQPAQLIQSEQNNQDDTQDEVIEKFFLPIMIFKAHNWKRDLLAAFKRDMEQLSNPYERKLLKTFDDLGHEAADAFDRIITSRGPERFALNKPTTKNQDDDKEYVDAIMEDLDFDIVDHKNYFVNVTRKTFGTIGTVLKLNVNLTDKHEAEAMRQGGTRLGLLDIKGDTKKAIYRALSDARTNGEGPYKAAQRIRDYVGAGRWASSKYRADLIARTETKYCQNWSSIEAYKSGGIQEVEIVDGRLPTSDEDCIARDGQKLPISEAMNLEEHPNGTLSFTPVIGDFQG